MNRIKRLNAKQQRKNYINRIGLNKFYSEFDFKNYKRVKRFITKQKINSYLNFFEIENFRSYDFFRL